MKILISHDSYSVRAAAVLMLIISALPLYAKEPSWGTPYRDFVRSRSSSLLLEFKPSEKPGYKHKILTFITGINPEIVSDVKVVRIRSNPVKDYMFVKEKLYTILENWDVISAKSEKELYSRLRRKYGKPDVKNDGNLRVISFKKGRTKVIYYRLTYSNGTALCKVYFYTTRLFRMLFLEQ